MLFPRWLVVLASWLALCTAYVPAPIHWGGLPAKKLFLGPGVLPDKASIQKLSWKQLQGLAIWDQSDRTPLDEIPHFTAKLDNTIAWENQGLCLEAGDEKYGDSVGINRCTAGPRQLWNFVPSGHGHTSLIQLQSTSKCLNVRNDDGLLNGAAVELKECESKATELWHLAEIVSHPTEGPVASSDMRHVVIASAALTLLVALGWRSWLWRWRQQGDAMQSTPREVAITPRRARVSMLGPHLDGTGSFRTIQTYPCDLKIKVIGKNEGSFAEDMRTLCAELTGQDVNDVGVTWRDTPNGKTRSVTLTGLHFVNADQVYAVYAAIDRDPRVIFKI